MNRLDQYSNRRPGGESRRGVPISTRVAVQFGGFMVQFGAAFFAFGMIFWWVFGAQSDVTSWFKFMGDLQTAQGRVTGVEDTGISEGGSDSSPGTPIYRVFYEYELNGVWYAGNCYGTGFNPATGKGVEIEYVADDPVTSRITGTRKSALGFVGILVAIFPAIGLIFMTIGLLRNARAAKLIGTGKLARGRLVLKEPTNTRINNRMVYRFTFEYEDEAGATHRVSGRTHHSHLLEDEETERLIYDPDNPDDGVLVDTLPGKPKVGDDGQIQGVGLAAIKLMILPVGGILAHGAVGVFLYLV
ncbi:MAG: DUF3592 domain-containing protein [Planctomycetes bacterium]|nr:DUF3592 domain-containing protein [Planctomycetota bacterium]